MPPPVKLLFGPMLIGCFFNAILYGVFVVQTFVYFQTYKRDATWIKLLIFYLLIAETTNTVCDIYLVYEPLVINYGLPAATTFFPKTLAADPLVTVAISTPVQLFIAYRIKIISRGWIIPCIIALLAIVSTGGGIWLGITVIEIKRFARKPELHTPALVWLASSAVADIVISVALVMGLTGMSSTDNKVNRIIRMTVQTGSVTSLFAVLDIICFLILPNITLNFTWDFALSKLYSNSLLSTLNARAGWDQLANAQVTHNVLFGPPSSQTGSQSFSEFRGVRSTTVAGNRSKRESHVVSRPVYEMDPIQSHGDLDTKSKNDLEIGVAVSPPGHVMRFSPELQVRPAF